MRDFSKFEKKLIERLVSLDHENSNIADFIVENVLKKDRAIIFHDGNKLLLYYKTIDDKNQFLTELIEAISLIKYLEKNDLLFIQLKNSLALSQGNALLPKSDNFQWDANKEYFVNESCERVDLSVTMIETSLYDILKRYISSFFTPGTEIKEYVKNGFISAEQKKHNQVLFWTRAAFIAALIPALVGVYNFFYNKSNLERKNSISQIHNDLIDINENINNKSFPEIIKTEIANDTLKVVIEKPEKKINTQPIIKIEKKQN